MIVFYVSIIIWIAMLNYTFRKDAKAAFALWGLFALACWVAISLRG